MTKRAFLFGGQGAQKLGMASDLYAAYPIVKETFDTASRILGYDLRELIDSNEEKLNQTRYTQPAILTTSVAIYRLLAWGIHGNCSSSWKWKNGCCHEHRSKFD